MKVLILGSGGREHAIAWKLAQSKTVSSITIAPGNAGWKDSAAVDLTSESAVLDLVHAQTPDLVVVGPEMPIANGIADAIRAEGYAVFAPSQRAGKLESSKAYAKEVMAAARVPSGRCAIFTDLYTALAFIEDPPWPFVIKADGRAGGKGVWVPDNLEQARYFLHSLLEDRILGDAGEIVLIEERLSGPEVSVLFACDGETVVPLVPARDYKRLLDGGEGPNTGGMGAIAPVPGLSKAMLERITREIAEPMVAELNERGTPYVGILYAGIMLTEDGPKVLEFNCRFGDPETQSILSLMDSDLYALFEACLAGDLDKYCFKWHAGYAATVVMVSKGYPGAYHKGVSISDGLPECRSSEVFHAGTCIKDDGVVTCGGRVVGVTGRGPNLGAALASAYRRVGHVEFEHAFFRRDIGSDQP